MEDAHGVHVSNFAGGDRLRPLLDSEFKMLNMTCQSVLMSVVVTVMR